MKMATYKIKDICDVINGRAYLQPELQKTGKYRILRVGNFFSSDRWYYSDMELTDNKYCCEGDLLFAWSASFGPKIWHGEKTIYHYHIWKMVPHEEVDKYYLYYWLRMSVDNLTAGTHGSVMAHMTKNDMENFFIDLPDKKTQEGVAAILATLDSKIECNAQINRNLEQQAQAIFKSWFVDFEPFGGAIPSEWQETHLSQIADFVSGYSYKGNELQPSDCAMATIKNFDRNGGFRLDGFKEIVPSGKLKDVQQVDLFDILVAHTDLTQNAEVIGNTELILSKAGYKKLIMSMDLVKVVSKSGISKFLLASLLRSPQFKAHALGYVNGTTVLHMSKSALPEYCFYFPTEWSSLEGISAALERMYHKMSQTIEESQRLSTLRDTLLPKLMSGEIDVSEVEV